MMRFFFANALLGFMTFLVNFARSDVASYSRYFSKDVSIVLIRLSSWSNGNSWPIFPSVCYYLTRPKLEQSVSLWSEISTWESSYGVIQNAGAKLWSELSLEINSSSTVLKLEPSRSQIPVVFPRQSIFCGGFLLLFWPIVFLLFLLWNMHDPNSQPPAHG